VPVTATITGLAPGTYYFCVKATNASGTTQGSLQVFTVPSTLADAILALKRAGGLDIASPDDASHLDAPDGTPGVDLMDAVAHARRTAGL
jgi:hypothetical protein